MSKPMFRIEQLIEALLKGSPDDPVYLRVGSSTYGIQAIDNGSIRVKSGKDTQDASQVVKTLRRYASGTPKGEDTGIAWRIVGVGGGTAIRSVSHDGSKIVVTTLANEGKAAEDSPDYDASAYNPISQSATPSGYDPVTFEAPGRNERISKSKREHNKAVSTKISQVMKDYDKTGKIGNSRPKNRASAIKQAMAVAFRTVNKEYQNKGKKLPAGVRRAETFEAPMGYGSDGPQPFYGNRRRLVRDRWGNLRFIRRRKDGTYMDNVDFGRSIRADKQRQAKTWAPPGFRDQGDGSPDLLMRLMGAEGDDHQECDNQECEWVHIKSYGDWYWDGYGIDAVKVTVGMAIYQCAKCGREKEEEIKEAYDAESAEGDTTYMIRTEYHSWDNWQNDCIAYDSFGPYATEAGAQKALEEMMADAAERWTLHDDLRDPDTGQPMFKFSVDLNQHGELEIKPSGRSLNEFANKFTNTEHKGGRAFDGMTYSGKVFPKKMMDAESSPDYNASFSQYSVWVLILSTDGMNEMGGVYSSKDRAKQAFTKHLKDLGGDPADVDFDSYEMTDWYDNEDPSLTYHSIRMYEAKLNSDFEMGADTMY